MEKCGSRESRSEMATAATFRVTIWYPDSPAPNVYTGVSDFYQGDGTLKFLNPVTQKYILIVGLPFRMEAEQ